MTNYDRLLRKRGRETVATATDLEYSIQWLDRTDFDAAVQNGFPTEKEWIS